MTFEFATPQRILFGAGKVAEVAPAAAGFGGRALLVTGADAGRIEKLRFSLRDAGLEVTTFSGR